MSVYASGTSATQLDGSVALVTGAASGIGRAVSEALAARGAHVFMSDIDADALARAASGIAARRTKVELDVRDPDAFATVVERITDRHGRLDILVNNAGTAVVGETHQLSLEHWRRVLAVNLDGVVNGVLATYPGMVARGAGHIVNIASLAGLGPAPLFTAYGTSKFAVVGLSLSLRAEAAAHGVKVSVVCPGVIETPLLDRPGPSDLTPIESAPDVRAFLTRELGAPYPAAALARDVPRAVERDRAILVAPCRARLAWRLTRLFPNSALAYAARAARRHQRELTSA